MASENQTPNRVADAAELLGRFTASQLIVDKGWDTTPDEDLANNRAAVIAAQILAVASQAERIADSQERIATALEWIVSMFEEKAVSL